jgi:DNA-binding response OmpR family regulator
MPDRKILLIEDDASVASFVVRSLTEEGYEVSVALDGNTGLAMALEHPFSIILLDVMLPGMNGIELCRRFRETNTITPIIMLTALGTTENLVTGLDNGADDYLTKPFKMAELLARIRSLARRITPLPAAAAPPPGEKRNGLGVANLFLDADDKMAYRDGEKIILTATEYRLLEYLLQNQRRVLSRMDLLEHVWGINFNLNTKVVDVYINYLRKKVDKGYEPKLIHTSVGMGYILKEEE